MTVIAYSKKHRILAADSRCSTEHLMHLTNCQKIFRLKNGALLGTSGDSDDRDVRSVLDKASPRRMPTRAELAALKIDFSGILVFPNGQVFLIDIAWVEHDSEGEYRGSVDPVTDEIVAIGHGHQYAYGVMEHGGSPIEGVRCACKRDLTCALPLQWESLDGKSKGMVEPAPVVEKKRVGKK